jgi:Caspase domain
MASLNSKRALVIGVAEYESSSILNLPAVDTDVIRITEALTRQDFEVEPHLLNPTRSALLTRVRQFCSSAISSDTLIIYFSGHGFGYLNDYYIVPCDAHVDDPGYFPQYLLNASFYGALTQSTAKEIIFFVDACREGIELTSKLVTINPFQFSKSSKAASINRFRLARTRKKTDLVRLQTVFSCEANRYSYFIDKEHGSVFTYSIAKILTTLEYEGNSLQDVLRATNSLMASVAKEHGRPKQKPHTLSEFAPDEEASTSIFKLGTLSKAPTSIDASRTRKRGSQYSSLAVVLIFAIFVLVVAGMWSVSSEQGRAASSFIQVSCTFPSTLPSDSGKAELKSGIIKLFTPMMLIDRGDENRFRFSFKNESKILPGYYEKSHVAFQFVDIVREQENFILAIGTITAEIAKIQPTSPGPVASEEIDLVEARYSDTVARYLDKELACAPYRPGEGRGPVRKAGGQPAGPASTNPLGTDVGPT